jgi:hypothetical protein
MPRAVAICPGCTGKRHSPEVVALRVDFFTIYVLLSIKKLNFVEQLFSFSLYVECSAEKIVIATRFPFLTGGFFHERF